ncbi:protein canopy homolog 1 isoform X2 [Rhinatrema bivittatum]|nr:protein canopy homolog 1 isoform X2 [Rhinatrema bivittatum]XP_029444335.1 protein canopy homolog 1 isoform X2 [Rhinatrema bivittatum]XP_029444336.1 protein canopy homolog 1 isoform X2 [Rhinatrema bivittatum]XP_029444337.1 protein canopy homolog 1 isoform X2 [Rhinatrema bivittatum]XP_029444338.1 protein canopy homolog 1 isoform X2 [Rhinatrema bivittatum]XP_029444339.1 protein canopy homolog 1 isoform X2 [Rhinatrema bivittatum]
MEMIMLQFVLLLVLLPSHSVEGKRDHVLYCGACRALIDELLHEISKVNPKKTTEVGSFRISPDGTQEKNKIPLAKSESYLTEVLENICDKMNDYSLHVDPETQQKSYQRFAPRDGEQMGSIDFNNFQFNPDTSSSLKFACESVVEDYEDEIFSLIAQEADFLADKLCSEKSGYCRASSRTEL